MGLPKPWRGKQKGDRSKGCDARAASRRVAALQLRQEGRSYREIAGTLGVDVKTAFGYVKHGIGELAAMEIDEARSLRALELARLDELLATYWRKAKRGKYEAVDRVLRILDKRAELLGLVGRRAGGVAAGAEGSAAGDGFGGSPPPAVPQVTVNVVNQQTIIEVREVLGVAKEHGLLDRLLALPEAATTESHRIAIEGEHAGNGNGHAAMPGGNGHPDV